MILEDKKHGEFNFSDGIIYSEGNFSIEYSINVDPNIIYFKVFNNEYYEIESCRISLVEPKYLDSDYYLREEEIDKLVYILSSKYDSNRTYWEYMIDTINITRSEDFGYNKINLQSMPDYTKLK